MPFCWLFFKDEFVPQAGPSFPGGGSPGVKVPLLQLSLCERREGRDGTAALWPVCGMRKWEFPVCAVLATSGALQLTKLGCVSGHSMRVRTPRLHQLRGSRNTRAARKSLGCGNRLGSRDVARDSRGMSLRLSDLQVHVLCPQLPAHITTHKSLHASTGGWLTPVLPMGQHCPNQSLICHRFLWTQFKAQ